MTDPNMPPRDTREPAHNTTVNVERDRSGGGGGGATALIVLAVIVVLAVVGYLIYANGGVSAPDKGDTNVDLNVDLPDAPELPNVEPPTLPSPAPAN